MGDMTLAQSFGLSLDTPPEKSFDTVFKQTVNTPSVAGPELLVSQLLVSHVERNLSPSTILELLRAQVIDQGHSAETLTAATARGVVEVITATIGAPGSVECLVFFSSRPDFPEFLSQKGALGIVLAMLRHFQTANDLHSDRRRQTNAMILDKVARRLAKWNCEATIFRSDRTRIINALKTMSDDTRQWVLAACPAVELLRQSIVTEGQSHPLQNSRVIVPIFATPADALHAIMELGEHVLAQRGVTHFRSFPAESWSEWKGANTALLSDGIGRLAASPFKRAFLAEWFFDGVLRSTLADDDSSSRFGDMLNQIVTPDVDTEVIKGILRALQRDLSLCATETNYPESKNHQVELLLQRASLFLNLLLPVANHGIGAFTKNFAAWAMQIPVFPAEARLFNRNAWQWLRILSQRQWEDDLKEPPGWVVSRASSFSALLFRLAPAFWLQEYAIVLLERLHTESVQAGFTHTRQHIDYVEFLCRTLRRKSPAFACRNELLLVLKLLGRATPNEENHLRMLETRYKMTASMSTSSVDPERQFWRTAFLPQNQFERFGQNSVAQALNVLIYAARLLGRGIPSRNRASSF